MKKFLLLSISLFLFVSVQSQETKKGAVLTNLLVYPNNKVVENMTTDRTNITAIPFFDGFEEATSWNHWTILNTADIVDEAFVNLVTTYLGADLSYEGERCVCFSSYNESQYYDQYIVTSTIDLPDNDKPLKASLYYRKYIYGDSEQFRVGYSTDEEFNLDNCVWGETVNATTEEYQLLEYMLPANVKHFVVHYFSNYSYYLFVDNISIDYSTSIDNTDLPNVSIYPNPAKDFVRIEGENIANVTLMDVSGKYVAAKQNWDATSQTIDTGRLANGVYFATITLQSGKKMTEKIIIAK